MKRAISILVFGLVLGVAAFACIYFVETSSPRKFLERETPELLWLKQEFALTDGEFKRVCQLHAGYLPHCAEMCRKIEAKNAELKELLVKTNALTPEIEAKLGEAAQLRLECQKAMLKHFYEVSRTMRPEQGKRYLAWVQEKTFLPDHGMIHSEETGSTHGHGAE